MGVTPFSVTLLEGTYEVEASLDGYQTQSRSVVLDGSDTDIHFDMVPGADVAVAFGSMGLIIGIAVVGILAFLLLRR